MGRLIQHTVVILLLIAFLPTVLADLGPHLEEMWREALRDFHPKAGDLPAEILTGVIGVLFVIGLVSRLHEAAGNSDRSLARYRVQQRRRERLGVRLPAEDVPLHQEYAPEHQDPDPDPTLPLGED